jgi:hypothetical protein
LDGLHRTQDHILGCRARGTQEPPRSGAGGRGTDLKTGHYTDRDGAQQCCAPTKKNGRSQISPRGKAGGVKPPLQGGFGRGGGSNLDALGGGGRGYSVGSTKEGQEMVLGCYRRHSGETVGCGHVGLVRICGVRHGLRALWI